MVSWGWSRGWTQPVRLCQKVLFCFRPSFLHVIPASDRSARMTLSRPRLSRSGRAPEGGTRNPRRLDFQLLERKICGTKPECAIIYLTNPLFLAMI